MIQSEAPVPRQAHIIERSIIYGIDMPEGYDAELATLSLITLTNGERVKKVKVLTGDPIVLEVKVYFSEDEGDEGAVKRMLEYLLAKEPHEVVEKVL